MPKMHVIKSKVEATTEPGWYWDTKMPGFCLRIQGTKKVYVVCRKVKGSQSNTTVTIGTHGIISNENARMQAQEIIGSMMHGINPNEQRAAEREQVRAQKVRAEKERESQSITLAKVLEEYKRGRDLKPNTAYIYTLLVNRYLADWLDKPIAQITKEMVEKRFQSLSEHKAQANHIMRILRALLTYASFAFEGADGRPLITENPVRRLSQLSVWHKIQRRQTVIKPHQLKSWYAAVAQLESDEARDFLLFLLMTGLRKNEAATLTWKDVDLQDKSFTLKDTKNRQQHTLPLSTHLLSMLLRRWKNRGNDQYVFGELGARQHLQTKVIDQVAAESGVQFTLHDLRRTFLTTAESLDISYYALKRLVNHKMESDVTAGYIVTDVHRLREPMERINRHLLQLCGVRSVGQANIAHIDRQDKSGANVPDKKSRRAK